MKFVLRGLLLSLVLAASSATGLQAADNAEITPDVVYGHKDGLALTFDVFRPANANGAAVLNMISGGWRSSWRSPERAAQGYSALLEKGFTVFAIRHGSSPKYYIPEIVADVRRAVRFIRHTAADYGIDESRMGVWGGSAGGHLSLVLATASDEGDPNARDEVLRESDRVAAVVAYYPPVDLRRMARGENPTDGNTRFPALNFSRDLASDFSPIVHVSSDDPPALMIHGDADDLVPISNSEIIHKAFQENGVTSKFITIEGAGHGFRNAAHRELALNALVDWFVDHLTEPTK